MSLDQLIDIDDKHKQHKFDTCSRRIKKMEYSEKLGESKDSETEKIRRIKRIIRSRRI